MIFRCTSSMVDDRFISNEAHILPSKYWTLAMASKKLLQIVLCGLLLICMTAFLHFKTSFVALSPLNKILGLKDSREKLSVGGLQILEPSKFDNQSDVKCVNAKFGVMRFPMCVYDSKHDIYVSKMVAAGKYFEPNLVKKWVDFFRMHPDVSFVDLGANLGTYSLPVAHSGIHVVAVEPHKDTVRRLAQSVHLGKIENNVDILHYALSNEESTTFLKSVVKNPADTFMVGNASCPAGCVPAKVTVLNKLIPFIRGKKAVFKVDIQEAEIKVFQRKSAAKFFEEIDVPLIQMEWVLYPLNYRQAEDRRRRVDHFLEFFYQRGYEVYDPRTEKKLNANWTQWTYDVLFKKEDLPKNQLFLI